MADLYVDTKGYERELQRLAKTAIPKAVAGAVNRTADEALRTLKRELPQTFTIRNQWVAKGFRTSKATPAKSEARVYHRDDFMARQASGGTKRGRSGDVAVPILGKPKGTVRRQVTKPAQWPGRLKRTFAITQPDGTRLLFQRTGRRVRPKGTRRGTPMGPGARDPRVKLMYVLKDSVPVPKRWAFAPTVERVVRERWAINLGGMLASAIRKQGTR